MSIVFSDTTNKSGLIQLIERNLRLGYGYISGNSTRLKEFTSEINLELDMVLAEIFSVGGKWQFDDTNHSDYPIITRNIVQGQRDYPFTSDETGNLILDIYKIMVADSDGLFREILPVDASVRGGAPPNYDDGLNTQGLPNSYDKLANGIFLDPIPDYSRAGGLKVYINREGSYFSTGDTTKKAGFAGLFHEILALGPSYRYAYVNGLESAASFGNERNKILDRIRDYYKARGKDDPRTLKAKRNNPR